MSSTSPVVLPLDFTLPPAPRRPAAAPVVGPTLAPAYEADRWSSSTDRQRWSLDALPPAQPENGFSLRRGLRVGADLGDGWRLEGSASPRRRGTVRVGLSRTF